MDSEERSEAALAALKSNKAHQYALKVYSDKLQAELSLVDKLLDTADVDEEEASVDSPGSLRIEGLTKAMGLLNGTELAQESSPFYADAQRRLRYTQVTTLHTMRPKELSILADAVRQENRRILTLRAQQRGTHPPAADAPELDENIDGLDWDRIAQSVTVASYVTRSGLECKVRWLGDRHPKYSHTVWTEEEREQARELAREVQTAGKSIDWVDIAERLGTKRTPIDVMRNAVARDFHIWDTPSEKRLQEAVGIYGLENWSLVARFVSRDATSASCQAHWYRSFDPSITGGPWTAEEDERLKRAVIAYGKSWVDVATVMGGRTSEKCRERFFGRKSVKKGRWNDDEDELLKTAVVELGTKSWIEISERVTGRSDTQCRARWGIIGPREEQFKTSKFPEPLESNQAADSLSSPAATPTAPRKKKRKAVGTPQDTDTEEAPEPSRTAFEDTTAPSVDQMPGPSRSRPRPRPVKKGKRAAADEGMLSVVSNSESATSSRTPSNQSPKKTPTSGRRKQPSRRAHGKMKGVAASEEEDSAK